jgi:hypothetical protein
MVGKITASASAKRHTFVEDVRQSLRPGLFSAALQAAIPLFFMLLAILFPNSSGSENTWGALATAYDLSFDRLSPDHVGVILLGTFIVRIPLLVGVAIITYFLCKRTARVAGSVRAGILACIWGNLACIAAVLICMLLVFDVPSRGIFAPYGSLTFALLVQFTLLLLVSPLIGSWGGRSGQRAWAATNDAEGELRAIKALAAQRHLGAFVRVFALDSPGTVLLRGIGLMVFFIALLLVQRLIFHIDGTEPAATSIVGVVATIGYLIQGAKRRGEPIHVFQEGVIGYSRLGYRIAIRWDEMRPLSARALTIVARNGDEIAVSSALEQAGALKDLIRHGITRAALD